MADFMPYQDKRSLLCVILDDGVYRRIQNRAETAGESKEVPGRESMTMVSGYPTTARRMKGNQASYLSPVGIVHIVMHIVEKMTAPEAML